MVNVTVAPAQIRLGDADAVIVGVTPTVRFNVFVAVQPIASVPVKVYIVVVVGVTTIVFPFKPTGSHV